MLSLLFGGLTCAPLVKYVLMDLPFRCVGRDGCLGLCAVCLVPPARSLSRDGFLGSLSVILAAGSVMYSLGHLLRPNFGAAVETVVSRFSVSFVEVFLANLCSFRSVLPRYFRTVSQVTLRLQVAR